MECDGTWHNFNMARAASLLDHSLISPFSRWRSVRPVVKLEAKPPTTTQLSSLFHSLVLVLSSLLRQYLWTGCGSTPLSGYSKKGVEIFTNNRLVLHLHLQSSNPYLFMCNYAAADCLKFICQHHMIRTWQVGGVLAVSHAFGDKLLKPYVVDEPKIQILAIPVIPLTMSAGLLFGSIIGTIIVSISGTVAASVAFLIARYFARDRILKLAEGNKKFLAIDKAIGENGFRVVTFLRLSPLLPFSLGNYLYGLTSVKFVPYTRNATGLVAPAIAVGLGALTYTLGTLVPVVGASGFATAAIATVIGTVVSSFR
ncbi:hypothetical protein TEA_009970 [Camellia sinensis var. sinensis]|uniref:VTT domain-containing protein n=1 Tax=Camellia sinensis var. sinensis TaxID=542762 RepID=A0A4V3WP65_CAMSN|nr:hypothetical protein TEA_009970 [Camellia sinensis var. sinensis]